MSQFNLFFKQALRVIERISLITIGLATTVAFIHDLSDAYMKGVVELSDLLLMFIYLEVYAMIASYISSGHLPVKLPLYMAIVSLSRDLILVMTGMDDWRIMNIALGMLIIAITVMVIDWEDTKLSKFFEKKYRVIS